MNLSERHKDILTHTLGLDRSDSPYRNHYCAYPGNDGWEDLLQMVDMGLMTRRDDPLSSLQVFRATDKAQEMLTSNVK